MGDIGPRPPQLRPGRALAHTTGASGSGSPHRSDSRSPQTPRGVRRSDPDGRLGTTPPVPGRPTSPLLLLGLPALLFALITWQVVADGPLVRVDERVSRALIHPDRFSELLADLGNVQVAVPVLAAVLLHVAWRARRIGRDRWWLPATAAAVLMALVPALVVPLKELTDRPGTPVMPPATGYFPSGHTATATVAYGSATLLLLPWLRTAYARRELLIACLVVNAAVGFGLIRRGYHWPLDVVASWCLGGMLLSSLWLLLSRSNHRTPTATPDGRTEPARPTTPSSHAGTPHSE
ncbi:phosphatase PAP2 family protein, partial [Streptomyces viridochromogenes]|uniref:phosphatase PAP2 family protein n=1 Tax=Streptomyces viridochromogenes TaxID=1938 RepID=UPI001F3CC615